MTRRSLAAFLVALPALALLLVAQPGVSQSDDPAPVELSPDELDRMMALMEEMSTPGAAHEVLDRFIGEWDVEMRMWMSGTSAPPTETTGTSTFEWTLDRHWVKSSFEGVLMGRPMTGMGVMGYDNFKKKYVAMWVDSASTSMNSAEGLLDRTGDVLTFYGAMDEYLTGEHDKTVKWVYEFTDDDSFTFEIHDLGIVPGETRVIEVKYTRKAEDDSDDENDDGAPGGMH